MSWGCDNFISCYESYISSFKRQFWNIWQRGHRTMWWVTEKVFCSYGLWLEINTYTSCIERRLSRQSKVTMLQKRDPIVNFNIFRTASATFESVFLLEVTIVCTHCLPIRKQNYSVLKVAPAKRSIRERERERERFIFSDAMHDNSLITN